MADNAISILIQAKDNASQTLSKVSREIKDTGESANTAEPATGRFGSTLGTLGSRLRFVAETFAIYKVGQLVAGFASSSVVAAGQLEQTNMAFQSLIGNARTASKVFAQLIQYANVTPFQSKEIVQAAQTLMGFGTAGQQTVRIIKQLGDVVSVSGGDLQALSLVTGQIFAQGKLRAQDMYQVINDGGAGLVKIMAQNVGGMKNLTAEFDKGGIPAKQYFDAITEAGSQGGFAFEGARKQADTFNGRLSTLKDSATQFGEALVGVKVDPVLGLQVQPGGLFDRMKSGMSGVTTVLNDWKSSAGQVIPDLLGKFTALASQVSTVLGPSFRALLATVRDEVMPALERFWHQVIVPLLPVIGTTLVAAIYGATNALNVLLQIVTPVMNFLSNHTYVVYGLAAAFVTLKAAMMITTAVTAVQTGLGLLTTRTIPAAMGRVSALRALIASPIGMGTIAVAGALADIALVMKAVQSVRGAISAMNQAKASAVDAASAAASRVSNDYALLLSSDPAKRDRAEADLHKLKVRGYATGTGYAPGGMALVGEHGPELVNLPRGSQVIPNYRAKTMSSGDITINFYGNIDMASDQSVDDVARRLATQLRAARAGSF